jgi:hypothetical protein
VFFSIGPAVSDPLTRRFERDAVIVAALLVGGGLIWAGPRFAAAVAAGAALVAYAYWSLRRGVDQALLRRNPGSWRLVKFFTRYAILAVAAYVMLARLRVSPVGFAVGASWPVVAVAATAIRSFFPAGRQEHPPQ